MIDTSFTEAELDRAVEAWDRSLAGSGVNEKVIQAMHAEAFPDLQKAEAKREAARAKRLERRRNAGSQNQ